MDKTNKAPKITCKVDYREIKVFINDILHIRFPRNKPIVFQSWYESTEKLSRIYKIEIINAELSAEFHYDCFDTWKQIIEIFNKSL